MHAGATGWLPLTAAMEAPRNACAYQTPAEGGSFWSSACTIAESRGNTHLHCFLQREEDPVTVFMGVPTMYSYLLNHFDELPGEQQASAR